MHPSPFTGTWTFRPELSRLAGPPPDRWTQRIEVTGDRVAVREEIVRAGTSTTSVTIDAAFDGADYPIKGSPLADSIAYIRLDAVTISGIARRNGKTTMIETIAMSSDGSRLTQTYRIDVGGRTIEGTAVFERDASQT